MKRKIINEIINLWDPFGTKGLAPKDEYKDISDEIINLFNEKKHDENYIKKYLLNLCASIEYKNESSINELYNILYFIMNKF